MENGIYSTKHQVLGAPSFQESSGTVSSISNSNLLAGQKYVRDKNESLPMVTKKKCLYKERRKQSGVIFIAWKKKN
jgi:hypothetical protein